MAYRQASKAGGKSLAKLLNGRKTGPKYKFKIYYNEAEVEKVRAGGFASSNQRAASCELKTAS